MEEVDMPLLSGKVILVSGGTSGVGAAVADMRRRGEPRAAADGPAVGPGRDRGVGRLPAVGPQRRVTGSVLDWDQTVAGAYE
jgi:NAD(P)-dependent dehydrogenase (short-subunit alcohol dehydrogenase family)